ncbi:hypothetical protein ACAX43_14525 [Paraburkholderia sp. IW21]|uniref:hypothetical protein n=1 Tax=Paraburkholderia sp. IW21 TaxID=3242488 RepID=UPI003522AF3C
MAQLVRLIRYDAARRSGKDTGREVLATPPPVDRSAHRIRQDLPKDCTRADRRKCIGLLLDRSSHTSLHLAHTLLLGQCFDLGCQITGSNALEMTNRGIDRRSAEKSAAAR